MHRCRQEQIQYKQNRVHNHQSTGALDIPHDIFDTHQMLVMLVLEVIRAM